MRRWHLQRPQADTSGIDAAATTVVPHVASLDGHERERYLDRVHAMALAGRLGWEPAHGFALTDAIVGTIAGHVALMTLNLPDDVLRGVGPVVVHPTTIVLTGPRPGPSPFTVTDEPRRVLGHTSASGPVFLAWDVVHQQARHPERGRNVVFHEFAHRLDALDGLFDGTPPLARDQREHWIRVCQSELDLLRVGAGSALLDGYAATNPAEFFAVTTERFFSCPERLLEDRPVLYDAFATFYRQDPAARVATGVATTDGVPSTPQQPHSVATTAPAVTRYGSRPDDDGRGAPAVPRRPPDRP